MQWSIQYLKESSWWWNGNIQKLMNGTNAFRKAHKTSEMDAVLAGPLLAKIWSGQWRNGNLIGSYELLFTNILAWNEWLQNVTQICLIFHKSSNTEKVVTEVANDPNLLKHIKIGDKLWYYGYNTWTNAQLFQWNIPKVPCLKNSTSRD